MSIKNVIFDLDGTLLDTTEGVLESVSYAAKTLGYPDLPLAVRRNFIGPPIQDSFIKYYCCTKHNAQKAAEVFREHYKHITLLKAVPYSGIYDLCDMLRSRNIKMSVATYKREDYACKLLRHFRFDEYCNPIHGADNDNILKKADIVKLCMDEMGATANDCVLIGDTEYDAAGAATANIPFIAVTYGFGFKSLEEVEKYPNIGIANSALEIADYILARR